MHLTQEAANILPSMHLVCSHTKIIFFTLWGKKSQKNQEAIPIPSIRHLYEPTITKKIVDCQINIESKKALEKIGQKVVSGEIEPSYPLSSQEILFNIKTLMFLIFLVIENANNCNKSSFIIVLSY